MIAATSCPKCVKPPVPVARLRYPHDVNESNNRIIFVAYNDMQGKKQLQSKMLYTITLEQLVPQDNFYRRLKKTIALDWLYKTTEKYYG